MSLFYLFLAFLYSLLIQLPMTGIKLRISSVGSNRSTNYTTTVVKLHDGDLHAVGCGEGP